MRLAPRATCPEPRTAGAAAHIDDARDKAVEVHDHIKDQLDDAAARAKDPLHHK